MTPPVSDIQMHSICQDHITNPPRHVISVELKELFPRGLPGHMTPKGGSARHRDFGLTDLGLKLYHTKNPTTWLDSQPSRRCYLPNTGIDILDFTLSSSLLPVVVSYPWQLARCVSRVTFRKIGSVIGPGNLKHARSIQCQDQSTKARALMAPVKMTT